MTETRQSTEMGRWPGWRSLLFTPADDDRRLAKVASRGADACILDLEDAVLPERRPDARAALPETIAALTGQGMEVLVRVNGGLRDLVPDLEAGMRPGVRGVLLPKAENAERVRWVAELMGELEVETGLEPASVSLLPMVETAAGLLQAAELAAACPRVIGLALGPEDLAADLGTRPEQRHMLEPARRVAWACAAAGRTAVGFPGSIANFRNLERLRSDLTAAHELGYRAALCIHPAQIEPIHDAFSVSEEERAWAEAVETAAARADAEGRGVASVDGQMIDRPVRLRAQAVLARWEFQKRQR